MTVLLLTLTACIGVKNTGDSWNKGTLDPALEGKWLMHSAKEDENKDEGPYYAVFKKEDGYYEVTTIDAEKTQVEGRLKTVDAGGHAFALLVPLDDAQSGKMWPYKIENNQMQVFTTKESMEIETLDDAALAKLGKDYEDQSKWEPAFTAEKVNP